MKLARRTFLHLAMGAVALPAVSRIARADTYPSRPVRIVVPTPAGGALDIIARLTGPAHRPYGAAIRDREPARRRHQYRHLRGPAFARGRPYAAIDPAVGDDQRDAVSAPQFRFHPRHRPDLDAQHPPARHAGEYENPAKTVPESIAWAKANPGKISMASGGTGSASHIGGELLKMPTGIDMLHVPYRLARPRITDLMGGQIQVYFSPLPELIAVIKGGKVRALGGDDGDAFGFIAGRAGDRRIGSGLRDQHVAGHRRAEGHPRPYRCRAQQGDQRRRWPTTRSRRVWRKSAASPGRCRRMRSRSSWSTRRRNGPR